MMSRTPDLRSKYQTPERFPTEMHHHGRFRQDTHAPVVVRRHDDGSSSGWNHSGHLLVTFVGVFRHNVVHAAAPCDFFFVFTSIHEEEHGPR